MPLDVRSELHPVPVVVLATPSQELAVELPPAPAAPVLETPVIHPIDLTDSHGVDFTLARLEEIAAAYDPAIEMAPLNFDHAYGGPSHGWCDRLWMLDGALWCRYVDLSAEAVQGIRERRWTRRSGEFVVSHPVTGGFYFTGLALLGTSRPAVLGLPPLKLHRPRHVVIAGVAGSAGIAETPPRKEKIEMHPEEESPVQLTTTELEQLRSGVALAARLRRENAELQAERAIQKLGSRVTPAMRRDLQPLLSHLMAQEAPTTIKLAVREGDRDVERELALSDIVLRILAAVPEFEALNRGPVATDDGPAADRRTNDEVVLHARHGITPERLEALRARFGFGSN
jgi:hypothetical protein